jgi:hypothetical protein
MFFLHACWSLPGHNCLCLNFWVVFLYFVWPTWNLKAWEGFCFFLMIVQVCFCGWIMSPKALFFKMFRLSQSLLFFKFSDGFSSSLLYSGWMVVFFWSFKIPFKLASEMAFKLFSFFPAWDYIKRSVLFHDHSGFCWPMITWSQLPVSKQTHNGCAVQATEKHNKTLQCTGKCWCNCSFTRCMSRQWPCYFKFSLCFSLPLLFGIVVVLLVLLSLSEAFQVNTQLVLIR